MHNSTLMLTVVILIHLAFPQSANARQHIHIVGAEAFYPFSHIIAKQYVAKKHMPAPVIKATGTDEGFQQFCSGDHKTIVDIHSASRKMNDRERMTCRKSGVDDFSVLSFGYDHIVLVNQKGAPSFDLTKKQLFMAMAKELPDATGKLISNPYQNWKEVDATLPDIPILVYAPKKIIGVHESFVDILMTSGCQKIPAMRQASFDQASYRKQCKYIRQDGKYIELDGTNKDIANAIVNNSNAISLFRLRFYESHKDIMQLAKIEGVAPSMEKIENGLYPGARQFYIYIKPKGLKQIEGVGAFLSEMSSDSAISPTGYLPSQGFLPLPKFERKLLNERIVEMVGAN